MAIASFIFATALMLALPAAVYASRRDLREIERQRAVTRRLDTPEA